MIRACAHTTQRELNVQTFFTWDNHNRATEDTAILLEQWTMMNKHICLNIAQITLFNFTVCGCWILLPQYLISFIIITIVRMHTRNNTDSNKLVIFFSGIALYYGIMILLYKPLISLHVQTQCVWLAVPDTDFHVTCSTDMDSRVTCSKKYGFL